MSTRQKYPVMEFIRDSFTDCQNNSYNYLKDGKCISCGECCGRFLPLSDKDIYRAKKYMINHHIQPNKPESNDPNVLDNDCPFLDRNAATNRCMIYPARPEICRIYLCDTERMKHKLESLEILKHGIHIRDARHIFAGEPDAQWYVDLSERYCEHLHKNDVHIRINYKGVTNK